MRRFVTQSFGVCLAAAAALVAVGLLLEPARELVAGLSRFGSVTGVALAFLAVVDPARRGRFLTWALAATSSAVVVNFFLGVVSLPLVSRVDSALAGLLLLAALAVVVVAAPQRTWSAWLAVTGLSLVSALPVSSQFVGGFSMVAAALWALSIGFQGALLAQVVLAVTNRTVVSLSATVGIFAAAVFFQGAAAVFQGASLEVAGAADAEVNALWPVALSSAIWSMAMLLVFLVARSPKLRRAVPAAAAVGAFILIASAPPAGATPPPPADQGVLQLRSVDEHRTALSSGMTAEVGAGPRSEFRGMTFEECDRLNSRDCFITVYDDLALRHGVSAAVQDIVEKVENNKGASFPAHCHQVVHNLGQLAWYLAKDFRDIAEIDPQVCGTGYTHGIWEQFFSLVPDADLFGGSATLCEDLNMSTPWYAYTCNHILGHILSTRAMDNPGLAMESCVKIRAQQGLIDCLAGGWMNFFQDDGVIAQLQQRGSVKAAFDVCRGASYETKFICYQEIFPIVFLMSDRSPYLAAQACLEFSEASPLEGRGYKPWEWDVSYKDRCIQGLARAVAVGSQYDYRVALPRCLEMPEEAWGACLSSVAASLVLNTGSVTAAFELCREIPDADYQDYCYFWAKHSWRLLSNGPNSWNMPDPGEVRLPESRDSSPSEPPVPVPAITAPPPAAAQ